MRISDWSSDVCSSDLFLRRRRAAGTCLSLALGGDGGAAGRAVAGGPRTRPRSGRRRLLRVGLRHQAWQHSGAGRALLRGAARSEEPTSELQSLMRISYAVFCLKKKNNTNIYT